MECYNFKKSFLHAKLGLNPTMIENDRKEKRNTNSFTMQDLNLGLTFITKKIVHSHIDRWLINQAMRAALLLQVL
mgnify:FL=1